MWDPVRAHIRSDVDVLALEIPDELSFAQTAESLVAEGGRGIYVGYSMGGRLGLQIALSHPELVAGLVLISCSAGIPTAPERQARIEADEKLARRAEVQGVEAFMAYWVKLPLFAGLSVESADPGGRAAHYSPKRLAHQLRGLGQGAQEPLWDRLGELTCPVMILTGEADQRYQAIGDQMAEAIPRSQRLVLVGGHSLALERPADVARAVGAMLELAGGHSPASA